MVASNLDDILYYNFDLLGLVMLGNRKYKEKASLYTLVKILSVVTTAVNSSSTLSCATFQRNISSRTAQNLQYKKCLMDTFKHERKKLIRLCVSFKSHQGPYRSCGDH